MSTAEVPRMYVVDLTLDDLNLDLPSSLLVFRADTDAGVWQRRMGHCNARALKQLSDKEGTGIKFTTNIRPGEGGNKVLSIVDQLNERFETVDLGGARDNTNAVLDKFGMADARPATCPSEAGPVSVLEDEVLSAEDTTYFRSATGSLFYLSRCTRPDITHSVMVLTRSMAKPGSRAMQKLKRVLGYLKGTISIGVRYGEDAEDGNVITAFVGSDFAGDLDKGYSTTGVVL
ncbi:unnamed protein product [Ectocarpus sp. CCAP 1310/34]|nr:unnamed protein product [Ectocarpus sp. CCAP 1310/34]